MPMGSGLKPKHASRLAAVAAAVTVGLGVVHPASADNWGPFARRCVDIDRAVYSAVLWNIRGSWERACALKGARIEGRWYPRPTRCVKRGGHMWGEFYVRSGACHGNLRWGSWKNNGCLLQPNLRGFRSYSSVLWGIPPGVSWERTCANTPVRIAGRSFRHPHVCVKSDLSDAAKVARKTAKFVSRRVKDPRVKLAMGAVRLTARIVEGVKPALNIWGVVYIPDRSCGWTGALPRLR
jgi:hypothetical protein